MWFAIFAVFAFLLIPRIEKIPVKAIYIFVAVWTLALTVIWVSSAVPVPLYDSYWVTKPAEEFAKNDLTEFMKEGGLNDYFEMFPFQFGVTFFTNAC